MSWIDDEARKARIEGEHRQAQEDSYAREVPRFWNDLRDQVEQDVAVINGNEELRRLRLGGDSLRFESPTQNGFAVSKLDYPALHLRVLNHGRVIEVTLEIKTAEQGTRGRRGKIEKDSLTFELDKNHYVRLMDGDGKELSIPDASRFILTKLLYART
jgi:hypothetical protein